MATGETRLEPQEKVLLINLAKYYGGAEVRTFQMARMLQQAEYPFAVAVLLNSPLHQRLANAGLPFHTIDLNRADIRIPFRLRQIIKEGAYEVLDTHNPQSHLWGWVVSKITKIKQLVTTVHGCYGEAETGLTAKLYDAVLRWNDEPGAQFIAVSESVQTYLNKIGIKQAAVTYSANAVLAEAVNKDATTIRALADWTDDTVVVTIAARLEAVKGINYLLQAFAQAWQVQPKLRLCIIGDGRLKAELMQQTEDLGLNETVFFTGFRDDVATLLNSADIFCLSSLSEGLPFALLEAALAKLALVLSSVGGMAEFFSHEKTALMFPVKDVEQLAQHLVSLANDPELRKKIAQQASDWVSENFSAEKMYQQTINCYRGRGQC